MAAVRLDPKTTAADLDGNGCGDHYSWISQIRRCAETPSEFTRQPVGN
jgi:hypothetical protein